MEQLLENLPTLPSLEGALPDKPGNLFRLHRLCLHIYGLSCRDLPAQAKSLAEAAGKGLRKKQRQELAVTLQDELPVLIALHALDRLATEPKLTGAGLDDLIRGLLLPLFAMSYQSLYDEPADPLKHVLARLDWYLDGDKGGPLDAFAHFLSTVWGDRLPESGPLMKHLREIFLPELDHRLELAFRYEFS
jgi:hypothetical protein